MEFVVVDIETTGLSPDINEIIEIGAVRVKQTSTGFEITERYEQLIKPYHDIPIVVRQLTGIDEDMLKDSPRFAAVADTFLRFVGTSTFVAHNAIFDLRTINESLKRLDRQILDNPVLDTQDLIAIAFPTITSHRLSDVVQSLEISTSDLHRALADAEATALVLIKCIGQITQLPQALIIHLHKILSNINHPIKDILYDITRHFSKNIFARKILHDWKAALKPKESFHKSVYARDQESTPVPLTELKAYFDPDGRMATEFPDFEIRPQQTAMAKTVLQCFNQQEHLLIEAGTGTGKSAAYLIPALLWIKQNGGPIVISTRTKNLQDQLCDKDLPTVLKLFPNDQFQILTLKGRQNYICMHRLETLTQHLLLSKSKEAIKVLPFYTWLLQTETGDISELHSSIEKKFGTQVNSDGRGCLGETCPDRSLCYVNQVRRQAKLADCIIANHALVFTDTLGAGGILPNYQQIILDEAHAIEESVTDASTKTINYATLSDELKRGDQLIKNGAYTRFSEEIKESAREFFILFSEVAKKKAHAIDYERKVLLTELHDTDTWNSLDLLRVDILRTIAKCSTIIDDALENEDDEAQSSEIKTHGMLLKQAGRLIDDIFNGEPNYIAWAIVTGSKEPYNISLIAAPIDIGEFLRELLFSTRASVIMTSATLMVNQSFDYFKQRFGIEGDVAEKFVFESVGSPFNYKEHMLCVIPDDLNKISEKENSLAIAEYLASIINIMQGRTLVLFTSYKMMEQTHKVTKHLIDDHGITILCQGMHGSRRALLSRFRHSKKTVLFGTSSFWEGVDIQGEALSCVVIVKLPFAVPTDPIVQARSALIENNGGSSFNDYSVPQAVIRFKQGIGRLIRSDRDHGTVVVIDERIFSKSYGKAFLKALPDCEIFKSSRGDVLQKMSAWMKVS